MEQRRKGVAVIISNDKGEILLIQRGPASRSEVGRWENPGGEVDPGEDPVDGAKREIKEELGVDIEITKLVYSDEFPSKSNNVIWMIDIFEGRILTGEPAIQEPLKCSAIGWFSKNHLTEVPLASYTRADFVKLGYIPTEEQVDSPNQPMDNEKE